MEIKLSYYSITPELLNLRVGGYYQIDPKSPRKCRFLHRIWMGFTLIWILIYTTLQIIKVYEERKDVDKVIETMFLFLTHTDSIYKELIMWIKADEIEDLLDTMKGSIFNHDDPDHKEQLLSTARQSKLLLRIMNGAALLTCFLWVLYPFLLYVQAKPIEFSIWLPYDYNLNSRFYITCLYVWISTSWLAICNTTIDVMICFLMDQCKTQIRILRNDLSTLVEKSKKESIDYHISFDTLLNRRFKKILLHHITIVEFSKKIEDVFGGAVFYQLLISAWIMCTSLYRMSSINPASIQFISMVLYIFCILMQNFIYCYYGNEINYESNKISDSAYSMIWYEVPISHRIHLIFLLENTKKSFELRAGAFIPLSNNTFVSIMKSSYSFYTLLKTTNENKN